MKPNLSLKFSHGKVVVWSTTKDLRRLAFDFTTQMNIQHRFNTEIRMAGYDWLCGFLSRHPELSIRKPEATNIARDVGFNKAQVQKFLRSIGVF